MTQPQTYNHLELEISANLLGVPADKLAFGLIHQVNVTRGEKIVKPLSSSAAGDSREALAKTLYGWMFVYIVDCINSSICKEGNSLFIGVLDIFGFEDFKVWILLLFDTISVNCKLTGFFLGQLLRATLHQLCKRKAPAIF